MIRFADPFWLLLLGAVAARTVIFILDARATRADFHFSSLSLLPQTVRLRERLWWLPFMGGMLGLSILVVALARPQRVQSVPDERRGIDIVIALDASGSMAAEDQPDRNRFEVALDLVGQFIDKRQDDRIGLVTFGSRAATLVPLTTDHALASEVLARAQVGQHGDGTAIGHAIATSVNRLRQSTSPTRVVILVTDGVSNAGAIEPEAAAELARANKVRVYTIGIGSSGPVPIKVRMQDPFTGEIETRYQTIRADLDEDLLTKVAASTGGEFFRATDARALAAVLARIDTLEKSRIKAPPLFRTEELYMPVLLAGFFLLLAGVILRDTYFMRVPA